ncbi:hypothetical protein EAF04_010843 [Stromatinia cepivora]|nr:hypothetical protein EAF04_010843 [Stromatinia cepivora]
MSYTHQPLSLSDICPDCGHREMEDPRKGRCEWCLGIPDYARPPGYKRRESGQSSIQDNTYPKPSSSSYQSRSLSDICPDCGHWEMEDPQKGRCEWCLGIPDYARPPGYKKRESGQSSIQDNTYPKPSSSSYQSRSLSDICPDCGHREMEDPQKGRCEWCLGIPDYARSPVDNHPYKTIPTPNLPAVPIRADHAQVPPSTGRAQGSTHNTSSSSHRKREEPSKDESNRGSSDSNKRGKPSDNRRLGTSSNHDGHGISSHRHSKTKDRITNSASTATSSAYQSSERQGEMICPPIPEPPPQPDTYQTDETYLTGGSASYTQYNPAGEPYSSATPLGYGANSTQGGETENISTLQRIMYTTSISEPNVPACEAPTEMNTQSAGYEQAGGTSSYGQQYTVKLTQGNRPPQSRCFGATIFPDENVLEPFLQCQAQQTGNYTSGTQGAQDFIILTAEGELVDLSLCTFWVENLYDRGAGGRCSHTLSNRVCCRRKRNGVTHVKENNTKAIPFRGRIMMAIKKQRKDYNERHQ